MIKKRISVWGLRLFCFLKNVLLVEHLDLDRKLEHGYNEAKRDNKKMIWSQINGWMSTLET